MTAVAVQVGTAEALWYGLGRLVVPAPVRHEHLLMTPGLPIIAVVPDWVCGAARDRCFAALLLQVRLAEFGFPLVLARLAEGSPAARVEARVGDDHVDVRDGSAAGQAA